MGIPVMMKTGYKISPLQPHVYCPVLSSQLWRYPAYNPQISRI